MPRKRRYALRQRRSLFGDRFEVPMPPDADVVIVCVNAGQGIRPVKLLLPHQVYRKAINDVVFKHPGAKQVTLIPASAKHYVDVFAEWGQVAAG